MRELISHPSIQFWVYQLESILRYTMFLPSQISRTYELSASHFIGVKAKVQGNHADTVKEHAIHDLVHHRSGMSVLFTRNDGKHLDMWYVRPDEHKLEFQIGHLEDTDGSLDVDAIGSPESMNSAKP